MNQGGDNCNNVVLAEFNDEAIYVEIFNDDGTLLQINTLVNSIIELSLYETKDFPNHKEVYLPVVMNNVQKSPDTINISKHNEHESVI